MGLIIKSKKEHWGFENVLGGKSTSWMSQGIFFKALCKICINSTVCPVSCSLWRWGLQGEVKGRTGSAPADQIEGA